MPSTDWAKVLGELAADEAVKTRRSLDAFAQRIGAIETTATLDVAPPAAAEIPPPPDEVVTLVERALAILAEPIVVRKDEAPLAINIGPPRERVRRKTITMRRDENGNAVADVVEEDES